MTLTSHEIIAYFSSVLETEPKLAYGQTYRAECLFCIDNDQTFTFSASDGRWSCRCGSGSIEEFEIRQFGVDTEDADPYRSAARAVKTRAQRALREVGRV